MTSLHSRPPQKPSIPTPLPSPLPPILLKQLNTALLQTGSIPSILTTLKTNCEAAGWQSALRERVTEILREGEVESRRELVAMIVREGLGGLEGRGDGSGDGSGDEGEGIKGRKEGGRGKARKEESKIRIPEKAIEESTKIVRGALEGCVVIEPEAKDFWA